MTIQFTTTSAHSVLAIGKNSRHLVFTMANLQLTAVHVTLVLLVCGLISAAPVQERQDVLQPYDPQSTPSRSTLDSTNATVRTVRNAACNLSKEALSDTPQNYQSPLFAYSELLERHSLTKSEHSEESRKKKSSADNECSDIERNYLGKVVPDNSSVLCPYTYKCDYDPFRYPRYIITAKNLTTYPINDTDGSGVHRCKPFGELELTVLQKNGSCDEVTIYHGYELGYVE